MSRRTLLASLAVAAFLSGTALRLWNLPDQILGGDEVHALRAALHLSLPEILVSYRQADNCIPLTALYKLFLTAGLPLSELVLRLPILLCGVAALVALPAAFAGRVPGGALLVYRWLLAISPALVLYSRIARSYQPMVLFAFGAVMAFDAWWRRRSWRWGAAYVLLGALALWFHLGAGPIVAAPFLFAAGDLVVRRRDVRRNLRGLLLLGSALTAACALFLVPARESLLALIASKRAAPSIAWGEVLPALLRLQAGTAAGWLTAIFWIAALLGWLLLLRSERRLALFTGTIVAGHFAGLLLLSPVGLGVPLVFARYLLPVLPFILFWVAVAVGAPWRHASLAQGVAAALLVLALAAAGPFADPVVRRTSFLHHNDFVGFYQPYRKAPAAAVPELYRQLRGETLIEAPWIYAWGSNRTFYVFQQIHGGRVMVATPQRILGRPPAALRNAVALDPAAFCGRGARYLVVHRNVAREEDRIAPGGRLADFELSQPLRHLLRQSAAVLANRMRRQWGEPVYADRWLRVWDLARVCGGSGQTMEPRPE